MGGLDDAMGSQEQHVWSSQDGDSNALILPAKKRKNTSKGQAKTEKIAKLSKSQKRKLLKLEEEKERTLLFKSSIEEMEKYKISEKAYAFLEPSSQIGQKATTLERRRKAVQYSKAGFEVPTVDKCFVTNGVNSDVCENSDSDPNEAKQEFNDTELVQPTIVERVALNNSSNVCNATVLDKEASNLANSIYMQGDIPNLCDLGGKKNINSVDSGGSFKEKIDLSTTSKLCDGPSYRPLTTPIVVPVTRPSEVEEKRKDLPIVMMEQEIMEAINENSTVIICGETGCGKTTQVPQFLYEAGYGSKQSIFQSGIIGVTQPRRVAVLATAKRVAFELGHHLGKEVGFQVRHDKKIGNHCSIKFMTDGILLREVQSDFLLRRYSVIVLDEAHERSLNTDILIGMLSRVIQLRQKVFEEQQQRMVVGEYISTENMVFPLKVVLMSATLRVEDFSGRRIFLCPPPVIEVPARQYPVTKHFSKRTEIVDYIGQAYKKVISIHKGLPPGGILVFVTGQREVEYLCRKLRKASRELIMRTSKGSIESEDTGVSGINSVEGIDMKEIYEAFDTQGISDHQKTDKFSSYDDNLGDVDEDESDISYDSMTDSELEVGDDGGLLNGETSQNDGNLVDVLGEDGNLASLNAAFEALSRRTTNPSFEGMGVHNGTSDESLSDGNSSFGRKQSDKKRICASPMHVLPLYAMLSAAAQLRVFEEISEGERLVVVATNVAETSLTIPGIKYVVDTGREKVKNYNTSNGMETFEVQWISKASADQRAGRAGRTGPGHCYRLYSSAVFNNMFPDFSAAEISKIPVDGIVLTLKSMGIGKVVNFPFPTPPLAVALVEADHCLKALEALDSNGKLTSLGKAMSRYPMSPRHSRMLLTVIQIMRQVKGYARADLVLGYAVAAAVALSFSNPFIMQFEGNISNKDDLQHDEKSDTLGSEKMLNEQELRKKELKVAGKMAREKFNNPSSDSLAIAYALQCFELSGSPEDFCNKNALHLKTMEEMSKLRKQLLRLVFNENVGYGLQNEFSWTHGTMQEVESTWRTSSNNCPLLLNEEEVLCQAICAGWADRIAKRTRLTSRSSEGDRKTNAVCYQSCAVKETIFLHRSSFLSRSAPEFLVYNELLHTKRPYMREATRINTDWMVKYAGSLCSFSTPHADPKPYYEPTTDQVFCWVTPNFGPHLWELPLHSLSIIDDKDRVSVFAYALLEGHVLPCLGSVRKFMAAPPSTILRPEAAGQRRVGNLLHKLKTRLRTIDSCAMLREAWEENPMNLHSEILDWFQGSFHSQFEELWCQMHYEVVLEPHVRFPRKTKRKKKDC